MNIQDNAFEDSSGDDWSFGSGVPEGLSVGSELGQRYTLTEKIGEGGAGIVYKGYDKELDRVVAIKTLQGDRSPNALERFQREAQLAASLRHPNVVAIHHVGQEGDQSYLVMEFIEGHSLNIEDIAQSSIESCLSLLKSVARPLVLAHNSGIVHRDIKPSNILIDQEGRARLTDFGIAWGRGLNRLTKTGATIGTPQFLSPEQIRRGQNDPHPTMDVWALGVLLYMGLTGSPPFQGNNTQALMGRILTQDPPPPRTLRPEIPIRLSKLCLRCLSKHPRKRPQNAREFLLELEGSRPGRGRLKAILCGLILVIIAMASWIYHQGFRQASNLPPTTKSLPSKDTESPPDAFTEKLKRAKLSAFPLKELKALIDEVPKRPEAAYELALLQLQSGDRALALATLQSTISQGHEDSQRLRSVLHAIPAALKGESNCKIDDKRQREASAKYFMTVGRRAKAQWRQFQSLCPSKTSRVPTVSWRIQAQRAFKQARSLSPSNHERILAIETEVQKLEEAPLKPRFHDPYKARTLYRRFRSSIPEHSKDPSKALAQLRQILKVDPCHIQARFDLCQRLFQAKMRKDALRQSWELVQREPGQALQVQRWIAGMDWPVSKISDAQKLLLQSVLLEIAKDSPVNSLVSLEKDLSRYLALRPAATAFTIFRAQIKLKLGRIPEAQEDLVRARSVLGQDALIEFLQSRILAFQSAPSIDLLGRLELAQSLGFQFFAEPNWRLDRFPEFQSYLNRAGFEILRKPNPDLSGYLYYRAGRILGWAIDKRQPNQSLKVEVYLSSKPGERLKIHSSTTEILRDDVNKTIGVSGRHGYNFAFPEGQGPFARIYAYAIDSEGVRHPLMRNGLDKIRMPDRAPSKQK